MVQERSATHESFWKDAGPSSRSRSVHPGKPPIALKGSGVLNYDDFGNLRVEIRADQATSDLLRAAGIEIRDGMISSDGRTVIDLQNKTLTYFVEGQRSSNSTGGGPLALNRPRHWEVTGDVLTLTTRDDSGAPLSIGRWKREPVDRGGEAVRRTTILMTVLLLSAPVWVAAQAARPTANTPEIFSASAQAKNATGAVSGTLEVRLTRYTPDFDRKVVEEALRQGGYPRFVTTLRNAPEVGQLVLGGGQPYLDPVCTRERSRAGAARSSW